MLLYNTMKTSFSPLEFLGGTHMGERPGGKQMRWHLVKPERGRDQKTC